MPRRLFALLALTLAPNFVLAQLPPQKALESLVVAPDLQVELFAHEPDVINPTSMDVDHLGRVWVCEAVNYRRVGFNRPILREAGDRIVILTDKDGDGKADESTVFYQGKDLYGPLGIAVAPVPPPANAGGSPKPACRVFVCQSPDILLFEDLDGDGKADGPPKKFLSGFKGFDHDHGVHGINIGPDGKLYFTVGDSGVDGLKSSDGKGRVWKSNATDVRAGTVWRCDMDGKNLELIAHNFRNNYECCVNSFGEIWLSDNDDDGHEQTRICHVMPGGNYGYHPRGKGESHWHEEQPGIVHKVIRTGFGSPTGICFYEGTLLPERFRGQLLHTDAGPRELRCFHLKPKGAGYEATKEAMITSKDSWFRLSDVCVAPDGSVFVADWYDPGVGGHGMGDWTRGRIYRLTPKGHKGYVVPKVDVSTAKGAAEAFALPNLATQNLAWRALHEMKPADSLPALARLFKVAYNSRTGCRIVWFLYGFDRGPEQVTGMFLKNVMPDGDGWLMVNLKAENKELATAGNHADAMAWLEIARKRGEPAPNNYSYLGISFGGQDAPPVCRDGLIRLRLVPAEHAIKPFYQLAKYYDGKDHFYRAALNIACGTDPARRDAILADFDKHFPEWNDKVADLVWELRPKSVLPRLQTLLGSPITAAQKARIVDILAASDDPAAGKTVLSLVATDQPAEVKSRAVENLRLFLPTKWKGLAQTRELREIINRLLAEPKSVHLGLQLVVAANYTPAIDRVADLGAQFNVEAIRALGQLADPLAVAALFRIVSLVKQPKTSTSAPIPIGAAIEAVNALGVHVSARADGSEGRAALTILQGMMGSRDPVELKRAALAALAGGRAGTDWLLKEKEAGRMSEELVADAGRLLRNSPFQGQRNKAMLLFPAPGKLDPAKLPAIATLAKARGETERGKDLMAASLKGEAQCLKCHTVRGVGGQVGPDLSMIGVKGSRENLLESILLPSKAIADQYLQYKVETKSGQEVMGLLVQQDANGVVLRDANGKDHTFAKGDIEAMSKSQVSIMPMDIVKALSEDELLDVVEYLLTLKTPSLTPDSWQVVGPFPVPSMPEGVDKVFDVERVPYDRLDTFMESGQRKAVTAGFQGKLHWSPVRVDANGYVDLMALHGAAANNSVTYAYRAIETAADQEVTVLLGTDDGAKLFVNGKEVFVTKETRAAAPEQNRVVVKLQKGVNSLLLKVANGSNPHGFYLTLLGQQEMKASK